MTRPVLLAWKVQTKITASPPATDKLSKTNKEESQTMKTLKLAALAALLALGTAQGRADQTNLVENIHLNLFGLKQGDTRTNRNLVITSVDTVRLNNRAVIQALGDATANSFSRRSQLVLVTPLDGGVSSVEVRDGDTKTDVTSFFGLEQTGTSVTASVLNTRTGNSAQITYSIQRLVLQDAAGLPALAVHFDVSGLGTDTDRTRRGPSSSLRIDAAGNGDSDGSPLVVQGSISVSGRTLEVVPDSGGGGGGFYF